MDNQPKTEPGSPPRFGSSNHRNLINMNIRELVLVLRAAFKMEDFDKVEEVLVSRYERLNTEIGQLREKVEMERLTRFHVEDEFRKREELCEKGKRAQESYERLLKEVKVSGLADRNSITELRKKNRELECEVCELKKLKEKWKDNSNAIAELRKKNGELVCEVCELKKLKQKWIDDKNVLAAIGVKNSELEEAVKKNLATINELRNENSKLLEEKRGFEMLVESLNRKCEELHGHVRRLKDDAKLLVSEPPAEAGHGVTIFEDKDEEDVEFGNDTMEAAPLQRNERIPHSLGVDGTAQLPNKGSKDAQGAPLAMACTMFTDRGGRRIRPTSSERVNKYVRHVPDVEQPQQEEEPVLQQEEEQPQQESHPLEQDILAADSAAAEGFPGGPVDTFVLRTYGDHVATRLWAGVDRGELRLFSHGKKVKDIVIRHDDVRRLVERSGLAPLLSCSHELVDKGLVSAFVERWHRDTNSFHLPVGEMTITLDDVWSLLHIPITGAFLTINVFDKDQAAGLLSELLGVTIASAKEEMDTFTRSTTVRYSWLLETYREHCEEGRWDEAARAFLLFLVGCTLFSDKSAFAVSVAYLECFRDLQSCGAYAWGAAALAHLYDNLCESSLHHTRTIAGYLTLLQAWIYEHFPSLCTDCMKARDGYEEDDPRALRWKPKRDRGLVLPFRQGLDRLTEEQVCWTPYDEHSAVRPFREVSLFRGWIRWGLKMYAHLPDRVLRQFGYVQTIPSSSRDVTGVTTTPDEMDIMFTQYAIHLVDHGPLVVHPSDCADGYMDWFRRISHPYIIPPHPAAPSPAPAPGPAVPASPPLGAPAPRVIDPRMIEILQTLLGRQSLAPDGIPLVMELMARMQGAPTEGESGTTVEAEHTSSVATQLTGGGANVRKYSRRKRSRAT